MFFAQKDINRMFVVNSYIESTARAQNSFQLQQPSIGKITDMCKNRARIYKAKVSILEWKIGKTCRGGKSKWRAKILLAPDNIPSGHIHAPDLALFRKLTETSYHPTVATTKI